MVPIQPNSEKLRNEFQSEIDSAYCGENIIYSIRVPNITFKYSKS